MKIGTENVIEVSDWDKIVCTTYGRPYNFQQQDGCQDRGRFYIAIPAEAEDFEKDIVPENVNDEDMGVSFAAWLARDPQQPLSPKDQQNAWALGLWWARNFYPNIQMVANDLHAKGLIEAGKYGIDIDW